MHLFVLMVGVMVGLFFQISVFAEAAMPLSDQSLSLSDSARTGVAQPYFELEEPTTVLTGTPGTWDGNGVHTLSIVEANKDGYRYWGYYCGGPRYYSYGVGLVRSNDLIHWDKYISPEKVNVPVVSSDRVGYGGRWPSMIFEDGVFYMFVTKDFDTDSRICLYTSADGISFRYNHDVVKAQPGWRNQNPCIFKNTNDGKWYLYYYHGNDSTLFQIRTRSAFSAMDLFQASDVLVMTDVYDEIVAAPSMFTWKGRYYLLTETTLKDANDWRTLAWVSDRPDGGFKQCSNSPLPEDVHACAFQLVLNNQLYITYSHQLSALPSWHWELRLRRVKLD